MDWRTDEEREHQRWRNIVNSTLEDVKDPAGCFEELFNHYARPQAWRLTEGTARLLHELAARGLTLGIASNYDRRLRDVVSGFEALMPVKHLMISSEVGYRKPAAAFFESIVQRADCRAPEILYVGDDAVNDVAAARASGLQGALVHDRLHLA